MRPKRPRLRQPDTRSVPGPTLPWNWSDHEERSRPARPSESPSIIVLRKSVVVLLILLGAGCASETVGDGEPQEEGSGSEWVGVLEHAESPNDRQFEGQAATIAEDSGLELGRQLVVSPAACWEGLQEDLDLSSASYVIAVVGASREEVSANAALAGYETEPSRRLSMCQD